MKKTIINTLIVVVLSFVILVVINKVFSKKDTSIQYAEVSSGSFEITVTTTGELIAENAVEIKGPEISPGRDVRHTNIKITDLIAEGTIVNKGDYVAALDRTEFENNLKDARERITEMQTQMEMMLLDTAVTMNNIRDQISNQRHTVEEAEITLLNSKYEPPTTIRQAEINVEQAKRNLEQLQRSYTLREALNARNVRNRRLFMGRMERRIKDYEELLEGFTVIAPASGMVIYKRDRRGNKIKVGSSINAMDRTVATLPDLSSMLSKVFVSEIDIRKIAEGQLVNITVDAFPSKAFSGRIMTIANIGEKLGNSDTKVFEVQIKIDGTDNALRPSMTTNNKIIIKTFDNVTYIPNECVHTGSDSIPFVYTKNGLHQVVMLGESNDKEIIVEKGLDEGQVLYITVPEKPETFRLSGTELIEPIKNRQKERRELNTVIASGIK